MGEINVVPYIDVMLVLLVIFMVTAPLLTQGVKVELPRAATEPVKSRDGRILVVTVKKDGRYYVNLDGDPGQALDLATAVARVAAVRRMQPEVPVNVGGDRNASYGKVVELIALLKQQGVERVGFLTDPPEH
jgi:biopolymer transport protein TolR